MIVNIQRQNDAVHFVASNASGNHIHMDGSPDIGGEDAGFRPMETVLAALGGCSAIDVVMILKKMRQPLEDLQIRVEGTRHGEDHVPRTFKAIHVHYILSGAVEAAKAARAVELSMEKYCSVTKMLEPTVAITHSFEIVP